MTSDDDLNVWQQVLALDAKYNAYRAPYDSQFRTMYLRRRSQLLREKATSRDKDYLRIRAALLAQRYGVSLDQMSQRSRTISHRSFSKMSLDSSLNNPESAKHHTLQRLTQNQSKSSSASPERGRVDSEPISLTDAAENYSFSGMHHIFDQHKTAVSCVKFAHDDKSRLACCSMDGTLSICQIIPPPATIICIMKGHHSAVTDFCWSQPNDMLLSVSLDGSARLWAVASGKCIRIIEETNNEELLCCQLQPANNNLFAMGSVKGQLLIMNISTGMCSQGGAKILNGAVTALCFQATGETLWAADAKGYITSFRFEASGRLHRIKRFSICEGHSITSISSRTWVSREAADPQLLVNSATDQLFLLGVDEKQNLEVRRKFHVSHRTERIRSTFCPLMSFRRGACVVSGSEDMCIYIFNIERDLKPCINKLQGHCAPVLSVSFNHDESLLASSDAYGTVILWKRENRQTLW